MSACFLFQFRTVSNSYRLTSMILLWFTFSEKWRQNTGLSQLLQNYHNKEVIFRGNKIGIGENILFSFEGNKTVNCSYSVYALVH